MSEQITKSTGPEFVIQRIYVKDLSFESPNSPTVFRQEWRPEVNLELATHSEKLDGDIHEVTLKITATVKNEDHVAFLCEIKQAGIFTVKGFTPEQLEQMLGSFCPNVLFPYAREVMSESTVKGGFPPLYLAPVNFDAYFAEQKSREKATGTTGA